jgi:hypothetical protein
MRIYIDGTRLYVYRLRLYVNRARIRIHGLRLHIYRLRLHIHGLRFHVDTGHVDADIYIDACHRRSCNQQQYSAADESGCNGEVLFHDVSPVMTFSLHTRPP